MDDYGRCQDPTLFEVDDDVYVISAKGSGQMFSTKRCSLRFRTKANQHLCVEFKHFQIDDCSVHFNLFQEKWPVNLHMEPDDVYLYRGYSCGDAPETVCSTATNLTLQLYKRIIHVQEYSFSVELSSKSDHDERWVIVGVISGLLLTVILVIVVCRCRKKNRQICEAFRRRQNEDNLHDTSFI
ncbi:uncharacterized protein LOC130047603 [Ostrea edulis]|uniref:uncharacterized protein LOC130047603 n=1 Tax=Ostrea edulis TaxID=37623 RepID=UPI0024AF10DD|nr:uncharacterized protein LOC130047603 [Ostrea edulis]